MNPAPVFVPYVNRPDLLKQCLQSISESIFTDIAIINNSGTELPREFDQYALITPSSPITFAQTQNLMLELAQAHPFYFFMHSDAEDNLGVLDALYLLAENRTEKWGAIFTSYDALACFNTEAMNAIGGWDVEFPWYVGDVDCYRRLGLAGYPTMESGLAVRHTPSQTLNSDPTIKKRVDMDIPAREKRYRTKWGGGPGHETFSRPFNEEEE